MIVQYEVNKLRFNIELNKEKLKQEIEELKKLRELVKKSSSYRLLAGKTQMIDDYSTPKIRTRLEHTNRVAYIAKSMTEKIYDKCYDTNSGIDREIYELNKEKEALYAEVMALSHDLGHTPYGHSGEAVINEFMLEENDKEVIKEILKNRKENLGEDYELEQGHDEDFEGNLSFEHNEQSAVEFNKIFDRGEFKLIDRRRCVKGIISHSTQRVSEENVPKYDIPLQAVRVADKIEYINMDYEELNNFIKFKEDEKEIKEFFRMNPKKRIEKCVDLITDEAIENGIITYHGKTCSFLKKARKKYDNIIYMLEIDGSRELLKGNYRERNIVIMRKLIKYYQKHPYRMFNSKEVKPAFIGSSVNNKKVWSRVFYTSDTERERVIRRINALSNQGIENEYKRLVRLRIKEGPEYGIEPVTKKEILEQKQRQINEKISIIKIGDLDKGTLRSDSEYASIAKMADKKYKEENLTSEAFEKIGQNRLKREEIDRTDADTLSLMEEVDDQR